MTIRDTHQPLSIAQRVRDRLEKQASGVQTTGHTQQCHRDAVYEDRSTHNSSTQDALSEQFLGLLINAGPEQSRHKPGADPKSGENLKPSLGTKSFSPPHKIQEESTEKRSEEKAPFSLEIQNTSIGPLLLQGNWANGVLQLSLKLPRPLSQAEQKVLCAMLSKGLSSQLGVPLEVSIA